jgi:very-short-patch-repair endonuclease
VTEPSDSDHKKSPLPRYGGGPGRGPVEIRTRPGTLEKAKHLRKNMTDAERRIWFLLRRHQMKGFNFRRQAPIGPYIVDFACLSLKLIIELDGGQHADRLA